MSRRESYDSITMERQDSSNNLNSVAVEKMVSNIRYKDDELNSLRDEIKKISETRDNLAAQLLKETEEKDKL